MQHPAIKSYRSYTSRLMDQFNMHGYVRNYIFKELEVKSVLDLQLLLL